MKKSSKVKYFGVAAAALLAVAPVVAPAFTAANNEPATVQAATGTPATITGAADLNAADTTVYAYVDGSYNNGILTKVTPKDATKTTFKDGDATKTINGVLYYVANGNYTYYNGQNSVLGNGEYYVPASIVLTYGYAVNQYFQGNVTAEDITTDGKTPVEDTDVTNAIHKQFDKGTALVTAVYTGTVETPAIEAVPAVPAGTEVTGEAGSYVATVDGTEVPVADENVTAASVTKDIPAVEGQDATSTTAQYYAVSYKGTTYFVPAAGLTLSGAVVTSDVIGTITTNRDDVRTYNDATTQNYTGNLIRTKGTQLLVDQKATVNGEVVAYHVSADADTAAGTWVKAQDVTFNDSVLVASAAKGTVTANADNTNLYTDKATTKLSGDSLVEGQDVNYTRVVKNSVTGDVVAYGFLNTNQGDAAYNSYVYVKAADVTVNAAADVDTAKLPAGTAVYSNNKAATIYTDAAATKDSGAKLSTDVNEWSAFETSTDADGNIVAYRLGKNQWVKAADLELQQDLDGTFDVAAGTTLYATDGDKTGAIENGGSYKVFAVRYINGKQSLKLGTDNQWVVASQGDFYPA